MGQPSLDESQLQAKSFYTNLYAPYIRIVAHTSTRIRAYTHLVAYISVFYTRIHIRQHNSHRSVVDVSLFLMSAVYIVKRPTRLINCTEMRLPLLRFG